MTEQLDLLSAAKVADWGQVVSNGGPPCFHLESGRFCLRAERWGGHGVYHHFVPLDDLLCLAIAQDRARPVPGEDELRRLADIAIDTQSAGDIAELRAAIRKALRSSEIEPCCQEFDTCEQRCAPLVQHLRQALRQPAVSVPASEPVAWMGQSDTGRDFMTMDKDDLAEWAELDYNVIPLYAAPPAPSAEITRSRGVVRGNPYRTMR